MYIYVPVWLSIALVAESISLNGPSSTNGSWDPRGQTIHKIRDKDEEPKNGKVARTIEKKVSFYFRGL